MPADPQILAQIARLGLRAHRVVEGAISGLHRSPLHGVSVEFADYREYVPGDDLKRLDWRAYARSGKYFIKRYEEESNLRATVLLDASASMGYGERGRGVKGARGQGSDEESALTKYGVACTLTAALAALLVRQRDAVGLALFDQTERVFLRPAATQAQLARIFDAIENSRPDHTTDLPAVIDKVCDQVARRGLIVIVSDLLVDADRLYESMGRLIHRGHEVIVFQVLHPDEIELPFNDSVLFRDIEGSEEVFAEPWAFRKAYRAAITEFIDTLRTRFRSAGIDHVLVRTTDDLAQTLSHYLHERLRFAGAKRTVTKV